MRDENEMKEKWTDQVLTPFFRLIIELSQMKNNDEIVAYVPELDKKELIACLSKKLWTLALYRPVFHLEVTEGLIFHSKSLPKMLEKAPPITLFLDALFRMKQHIQFMKSLGGIIGLRSLLRYYITDYYDAMSGGLPIYEAALIVEMIKLVDDRLNMQMELYPRHDGDGWYTIGDFVAAVDPPDLSPLWRKLKEAGISLSPFRIEGNNQ